MTLERGALLNKRYRIVEILGQGGMAAVYRAVDENLGVEVAVKENLFTTDEYARQFRREAVILANLRHPNLPRVTDHFVIEQQGQYLVMDYIEGEDLRQRIDRVGLLPDEEVIIIGAAICDALAYMHSCRPPVLHRDIKPGNVKITPEGKIFLVDFGLAKVVQGGQETTTGARAMTPGYSPPEQYGTAHTDARTDIYSLGATLYSALTDAIPEDGLARAMEQAELTSIRKHVTKVSRRLATVIEKALAVLPDDRYQTADEFKQDLLSARSSTRRNVPMDLKLAPPPPEALEKRPPVEGEEAQAVDDAEAEGGGALAAFPKEGAVLDAGFKPPSRPRRRRKLRRWLLSVLPIVLIAVLLVLVAVRPGLPQQIIGFLRPTPTFTATLRPTASPLPPTVTATVAVTATEVPPTATVTATLTPTPRPTLTPTPQDTATTTPVPTPVGSGSGLIAFASDRSGVPEIWLLSLADSSLKQLTTIAEGACQPSWNKDGTRLVFVSPCPKNQARYPGASLFIIDADGQNLTPLPSIPGGDYDPAWSPVGDQIAFTSVRNNIPQIYIMNLADYSVLWLEDPAGYPETNPTWSPDGMLLAYVRAYDQIWVMTASGENRHKVTRGVSYVPNDPVWSPDGNTIAFSQNEVGLAAVPWLATVQYSPNGNIPLIIAPEIAKGLPMGEPSYSPDGLWLAYSGSPDGLSFYLFIMNPNGVNRQQLTKDAVKDFDPAWSP